MSLQERTQALLDLVERDRSTRCDAIAAAAQTQAAELLAQARREARERVRDALATERERVRAQLAAALAELQTQRRVHAQARTEALLALAWQALPAALRARWLAADTRATWAADALAQAEAVLPRGVPWQVQHAPEWAADEVERFAAQVAARSGQPPRCTPLPTIDAGLRLAAAGLVVDATTAGLLADRDEIGGRLVGMIGSIGSIGPSGPTDVSVPVPEDPA